MVSAKVVFASAIQDAKRIAEITGISVLTVRKHIANIYRKLHVNSKAQAMRVVYNNCIIN